MKYAYLLLIVMIIGCNNGANEKKTNTTNVFNPIDIPPIKHRSMGSFGGEIKRINENSWVYSSNKNYLCVNKLTSSCRKAISSYDDAIATSRVIKTEFEFTLIEYDVSKSPYWVILYQDWLRIIPTDSNGNHPISTIKIKTFDNAAHVCHYDNAWQWGYDFGENRDGDTIDVDHTLHQENTKNGCKKIDVNVTYNITIITDDSGLFSFYVNDRLISKKTYKTKSLTEKHVIQWGIYTSKGYNLDNNPLLSVMLRIDDLKLSILD